MRDNVTEHLIPANEAEAYVVLTGRADGGLILVCDHAANAFPPGYGTLGLPQSELARHIAYDIGAAGVTFGAKVRWVDIEKEKKRLTAEVGRIDKVVKGIEAKLSNASFVERAPPEVIETTTAQRDNMRSQLENLKRNLDALA